MIIPTEEHRQLASRAVEREKERQALELFTAPSSDECSLPPFRNAAERFLLHKDEPRPNEVISGLLHEAERLLIAGPSKAGKSWFSLDLALSVASGEPFLGMPTERGRVLYLNYELGAYFLDERVGAVAEAKGCVDDLENFDSLTLQDQWGNFDFVRAEVSRRLQNEASEGRAYSLVVIDPLYSLLEDQSENDNSEMGKLMAKIGEIATETGAAVAIVDHFAKGNSGARSSTDRAAGAGVKARFVDGIVTINHHADEDDARIVEFTLRNFPEKEKLALRRRHPLFVFDEELDPARMKGQANGPARKGTVKELTELLELHQEMSTGDLLVLADEKLDIGSTRFHSLLKEARSGGYLEPIFKEGGRKAVSNRRVK